MHLETKDKERLNPILQAMKPILSIKIDTNVTISINTDTILCMSQMIDATASISEQFDVICPMSSLYRYEPGRRWFVSAIIWHESDLVFSVKIWIQFLSKVVRCKAELCPKFQDAFLPSSFIRRKVVDTSVTLMISSRYYPPFHSKS